MRDLARFLLGVLVAYALFWLSVAAYGFVVAHVPIPSQLLQNYASASILGIEFLAFLPFVTLLAFILRKLFHLHAVVYSFACCLTALVAALVPTAVESTGVLMASLRLAADVIVIFVVGVPLLIYGMQRWQANPTVNRTRLRRAGYRDR
jgi:hypothetical protein